MNILIDISHPAHVHFFKNAIRIWEEHGHAVKITARDKDVTLKLLDDYGLSYKSLSKIGQGFWGLSFELLQHESKLVSIAKNFRADVILEIGGTFIVHAGKLLGIKTVVFSDTEHAKLSNLITFPFASYICTPDSYKDDLGKKHIKYPGYQELAYLHPDRFLPNPDTLSVAGLELTEKFFILRFVSWGASHDIGQKGLSVAEKIKLVELLKEQGKVLITSEGSLPVALEPYQIHVSPKHIHDLLYYSSMYVGEGATMATEAAILGTPSIYINPLGSGNLDEIIHKYELIYHYPSGELALAAISDLVNKADLKEVHKLRQKKMLDEKIDVTRWMVNFVESLQ
ncbi:MAG: DUF354 domain-containing protein [Brevefilum sp.]|nr:DUF354 domain-containing protein [Brevefilum sp.]